MHNPPSSAETKPVVVLVIYAAFVAASLMYLGIHLSGIMEPPDGVREPQPGWMRAAMYAAAIGLCLSAFAIPPLLKSDGKLGGVRVRRTVLRLAMFEAIAVFGVVGPFVGLSRGGSLGFIVASIALLLAAGLWVLALYQSLARPAAEQNYRR